MKFFFGGVFLVVFVLSPLFFAGLGLVELCIRVDKGHCERLGQAMEMETKYVRRVGCLIKTKSGSWVLPNKYRVVE